MISENNLDRLLGAALQSSTVTTGAGVDLTDRVRAGMAKAGHQAPRRVATLALVAVGTIVLTSGTALAVSNANTILQALHLVRIEPAPPAPSVLTLADAKAQANFKLRTLDGLASAKLESVVRENIAPGLRIDLNYRVGSTLFAIYQSRDENRDPLSSKVQQLSPSNPDVANMPMGIETLNGRKYLVQRTAPGGAIVSISWKSADGVVIGITVISNACPADRSTPAGCGADTNTVLSVIDHLK